MTDILIIGAGMAGLTSAIYAARALKDVLVLEREGIGGQIARCPRVENFPGVGTISGAELSDNLYEQAVKLGAKLDFAPVSALREEGNAFVAETEDGERLSARSVILATGVKHKPLGVERETEFIGHGISYCPVCDGAFFKGEDVAVVGGGNTAMQAALFLSGLCRSVTVIHRRDFWCAERVLTDAVAEKPNVRFQMQTTIEELQGGGELEALRLMTPQGGETLPVGALFVCVGQTPDNAAFSELVTLDDRGYIAASEDCQSSHRGIFAAGDCRRKEVRQLTTAAADGSVAAIAAIAYLDRL